MAIGATSDVFPPHSGAALDGKPAGKMAASIDGCSRIPHDFRHARQTCTPRREGLIAHVEEFTKRQAMQSRPAASLPIAIG